MSLFFCFVLFAPSRDERGGGGKNLCKKQKRNPLIFRAVSDEICLRMAMAKNECLAAAENCVWHIWHSFIIWSCLQILSILCFFFGGIIHGYYVFNTFMIHHKSGCISHPTSLFSPSTQPVNSNGTERECLFLLCLLCLHYQNGGGRRRSEKEKSFWDNFHDIVEKKVFSGKSESETLGWNSQPARFSSLLQIFTYSSFASASVKFSLLLLFFPWFSPIKSTRRKRLVPLASASSKKMEIMFLGWFHFKWFCACLSRGEQK